MHQQIQIRLEGGLFQPPSTHTKPIPSPAGPPAVTPPPANVPRKAQVGRPTKMAEPIASPQAAVAGSKKALPPKPSVTRSQKRIKWQPNSSGY